MTAGNILAVFANILLIVVYIAYMRQVVKGQSTPNPATWIIWFIVMLINSCTYILIIGNLYKSAIAVSAAIFIGIVLTYSLVKGKFGPLKRLEIIVLATTVAIIVFWIKTGDAHISNLLLQIIILISFVPTAIGLLRGDLKEKIFPWALATAAYLFQIVALLIDFKGNYVSIAYPFINGICGNGSIAVIILWIKSKRT